MRDAVLGSQPQEWRNVVTGLDRLGGPLVYEKQMAHHMLPDFGLEWVAARRNAFLIRDPAEVLASYVIKRGEVTLEDIGIVRQHDMFLMEADRLGAPPPVLRGADVLADPPAVLALLCNALGVTFDAAMLTWPAGGRSSDGIWAPAWYDAVERSTGFASPYVRGMPALPDALRRIADMAQPYFEALMAWRLRPDLPASR